MYVLAAVGLAALLIIVYAAQRWRRAKGENIHRFYQQDFLINGDFHCGS